MTPRSVVACCAAAVTIGAGPAQPSARPLTVPLRNVAGLLVVDATIDGRPAPLLLDTGAWRSMVDTTTARELGLARDPAHADVVLSSAVDVGALSLGRVPFLVRPSVFTGPRRAVAGILGADFFQRFVVRLDFAARTMTLFEPRGWSYGGDGSAVPFTTRAGMPVVDATLAPHGGAAVGARLLVDAGTAGLPFVLTTRFARTTSVGSPPESLRVYGMSSTVRGGALSHTRRLRAVTLGPVVVEEPFAVIAPAVDDVLADSVADGTIGLGVLARTVLYVDYARRRIILEKGDRWGARY